MLNKDGIILDDVVIFRLEENKFWISTLHKPRALEALEANKGGKDVEFHAVTKEWEMYSVQGPKSKELVNAITESPIDGLKFFSISDNKIGDTPVKVVRGGYTGEKWGYEIYVAADQKDIVESALGAKEAEFGAKKVDEIDVVAYTLPTEKGFVLITDINESTPFEVGMDKTIDWSKDFVGKASLEALKDVTPKRALVGLKVSDKNAKVHGGPKGAPIYKDGKLVGMVKKFTYGFSVDANIGFALVDRELAKIGDKVILNNSVEAVLTERAILG
jgi:aminomethyltransferase